MNTRKTLLLLSSLLSVILLASSSIYAQPDAARSQVSPSFEAMLQVIVGSNDAVDGASLPSNLRAVSGQLKANFGFPNYRLYNTFVGRVGTNGMFEYKSISSNIGTGVDSDTPTFLEWTLGISRTSANEKGQIQFQAEPFRFGARVPVKISTIVGDTGRTISNVNYESVGLTVNRVSLVENTPTLIGTLSLPKTAGTLFLVLTVKPAQ